jgi:hypothetical protein
MTYEEFKKLDFDNLKEQTFTCICERPNKIKFITPIHWDGSSFSIIGSDYSYYLESEVLRVLEEDFDWDTNKTMKIKVLKVILEKAIIEEYLEN